MARILITDLEPGMVLASELRTSQGRLLLREGLPLDEGHIRLCKRWGVSSAEVKDVTSEEMARKASKRISAKAMQLAQECAADRLHAWSLEDPVSQELVRLFVLRMARRLDREGCVNPRETPLPAAFPAPRHGCALPPPGKIAGKKLTMASLPESFGKIIEALEDPKASSAYIAEVISGDSSLSARLLKVVNSPYYGFAQRIDTLQRAVTLMGSRQLGTLAVGISVFTMFQQVPATIYSLRDYCRHSLACAIVARHLAGHLAEPAPGMDRERLFAIGLLHDLGRMIALVHYPEQAMAAMVRAMRMQVPLHDMERELWGYDHAELAGFLLRQWRFPEPIVLGVGAHHPPFSADSPREALLVHLADVLAHLLDVRHDSILAVPPLEADVCRRLGLEVEVLATTMDLAANEIEDTLEAFMSAAA